MSKNKRQAGSVIVEGTAASSTRRTTSHAPHPRTLAISARCVLAWGSGPTTVLMGARRSVWYWGTATAAAVVAVIAGVMDIAAGWVVAVGCEWRSKAASGDKSKSQCASAATMVKVCWVGECMLGML